IDGGLYELFDGGLAPRVQRPLAKPSGEAACACKANTIHLERLPVEHAHAGIFNDLSELLGLPALIVVVAKHGEHRNSNVRAKVVCQYARLLRRAVIRQVSAEQQYVGFLRRLFKDILQLSFRFFVVMKVAYRCYAHVATITPVVTSAQYRFSAPGPVGAPRTDAPSL